MVGCSQGRTRVSTCKSEKSDENRHRELVRKESSHEQGRMIVRKSLKADNLFNSQASFGIIEQFR